MAYLPRSIWIVVYSLGTARLMSLKDRIKSNKNNALRRYLLSIALPLLILLPAFFLLTGNAPKKVLTYVVILWMTTILFLAPWIIRNLKVFGEWIPTTTNSGVTFLK